jgi:CheY-like chemotaxis protein
MPATKAPYKILVVDDEPVVRAASRRLLMAGGFAVLTTGDAESALALMPAEKPDVVVADLKLPGLSGIAFMEVAREIDPRVVVIITTGYSSVEQATASLQHGAFDFLPKPFTFDELLSPVRRACRYLALPEDARDGASAGPPPGYYLLGLHAWAKPEADGTALLGVTEVFHRTLGPIEQITLPGAGDRLRQGGLLTQIATADHLVHAAWSPLSGRVLAVNHEWEQPLRLAGRDLLAEGWIARIQPADLAQEVERLRSSTELSS